jgi:hypothetical protein
MTYDIAPEKEQEYFEFVVREFIPGIQKLGFEVTDAWATVYGKYPKIMVGAVLPSLNNARQVLSSKEWEELSGALFKLVRDYHQKLVQFQNGFQF